MDPSLKWMMFDDDAEIGRKVWLGYDEKGQFKAAHVEQEVDQILEANMEAEKASHGLKFGEYNRVASVPLTFLEKTGIGEAIDGGDKRFLSKILNDPDNSKFRTSRGKI